MEYYSYQPLQGPRSIRLLSITRESLDLDSVPLHGSLTELNLDNQPDYEALSYCWGNVDLNVPFVCNRRVLYITRNCNEALRRLLRGKWRRSIWVDSICINQYDLLEKNHQVQMMGDIYRYASAIRVWLGPQTEHSDTALSSLKSLTIAYALAIAPGPLRESRQRNFDRKVREMADRDAASTSILPFGLFGEIFRRPWFSRMWVTQEVVMPEASKVMFYCGDHMIHLTNLAGAIDWTTVPGLTMSQRRWFHYTYFIVTLKQAIAARESGLPVGITLSGVLAMVRLKEATNPRDKIFALYNTAQRLGWQLPEPRYEKSVEQVFTEATAAAMRNDRSLEILYHADSAPSSTGRSLWVPDYGRLFSINNTARLQRFAAAGQSWPQFSFSSDESRLVLRGIFIDIIHDRASTLQWDSSAVWQGSTVAPPGQIFLASLNVLREWIQFARSLPPSSCTGYLDDALAKTLLMASNNEAMLGAYHQLQSLLERTLATSQDLRQGLGAFDPGVPMLERLLEANVNMTFVHSESGRVGTAPGMVEPNDVVVLLAGSRAPAVLRQKDDHFLLIGFGYINGVMNGELWDADVTSRLEEYTII